MDAGTVYLIHFDKPYKHAAHYLGFCEAGNLGKRLKDHLMGRGARLLQVVNQVGIHWSVVRTWKGERYLERAMKNRKKTSSFCPTCINLKKEIAQ